jgi:hypothetical protein
VRLRLLPSLQLRDRLRLRLLLRRLSPLAELNERRRLWTGGPGDCWWKLLDLDLDLDLRSESSEKECLRRRESDALVEMVETESTDGDRSPVRRASTSRMRASSRSSSSLFFARPASLLASSASTIFLLHGVSKVHWAQGSNVFETHFASSSSFNFSLGSLGMSFGLRSCCVRDGRAT